MGEVDEVFLDQVGLGDNLFTTQGKLCATKIPEILDCLQPNSNSTLKTKARVSSQLQTWASIVSLELKKKAIIPNIENFFGLISDLATQPDDSPEPEGNYNGIQCICLNIASAISVACATDQSYTLSKAAAPKAFVVLERITDSGLSLSETNAFITDSAATKRSETCQSLLQTCPYQGHVNIPNAFTVIKKILFYDSDSIDRLKQLAKSTISTLSMVNKECLVNAGEDLMDIILKEENHDLIYIFASVPEIYTNSPECIHKNISLLLNDFQYTSVGGICYNVSKKHPEALAPYAGIFVEKISSDSMMGALTLMIISEIAAVQPNTVYPLIPTILNSSQGITGGDFSVAAILGRCGSATIDPEAPDKMFLLLIKMLDNTDSSVLTTVLTQISNLKVKLSSPDILRDNIPLISKHRAAFEIIVTEIEDYASGITLRNVNDRVVVIEEKIIELNRKVSESCKNFDDVIAYVDANVADLKDFIGEVSKKVPNPRRLEVVGTLRKTLLLHFECCHTGREYAIESHEWSKWLKMGFSLIKAGKCVIDIGMGNPIGLIHTGVTLVSELYQSYKTNDDDEFNTYITQPFLTSAEQDVLIEKLRAQKFFDKFAYDSQVAGWYLLFPEKDGKLPEGEAGGVSKVWKKEGYGIGETIQTTIKDATSSALEVFGGDASMEATTAMLEEASGAQEDAEAIGEVAGGVKDDLKSSSKATPTTTKTGSRAAALKSNMIENRKVEETVRSATNPAIDSEKSGDTNLGSRAVALRNNKVAPEPGSSTSIGGAGGGSKVYPYDDKISKLEERLNVLEKQNQLMYEEITKLKAQSGGGGCVIS